MKYSILAAGIATALTFPLSAQQQKTTTNNEEAVEVITVKSEIDDNYQSATFTLTKEA